MHASLSDVERWATFDCYGTLIDWNTGISSELSRLFPGADAMRLLDRYHSIEADTQRVNPELAYRDVLEMALARLATEEGFKLPDDERAALVRALPTWDAFPEVGPALRRLRSTGWRLAILSNSDGDLIAASKKTIGVPFDETVVASEIGAYKPEHRHWHEFFARTSASPLRHVHVAASVFHDISPCAELGLQSVWINRQNEPADARVSRELPNMTVLPQTVEELVPEVQ